MNQKLSEIDYPGWIYPVGPDPTGLLDFSNPQSVAAVDLANAYIALDGASSPANFADYNTFSSNQRVVFCQTLLWNTLTNLAIIT